MDTYRVLFTKLNSDNYFTWKYKMEMYLRKEKLWHIMSTERPEIPATGDGIAAAELKLNEFLEVDGQARALISLCVEDNQLVHIRNLTSAREIWTKLKEYYERNTLVNKVSIMRRICGMKMSENDDMEKHIGDLTDQFQKLVDLGENQLNDNWKVAITLSSLPPSYDTMITALEARPDADLTLSLIHSKLINEHLKRKNANNATESSSSNGKEMVLKTKSNKLKCFFCKKTNHIKKDCLKYKQWLKKQENKGNDKEKVNKVEQNKEFLFKLTTTSSSDDCWIVDSGATSHCTDNKHLFETFESAQNAEVEVANGEIEHVKMKGTCVINLFNNAGERSTLKLNDVLYAPNIKGSMFSVKKIMKDGYSVHFKNDMCEISRDGKQIAVADEVNGLFKLRQTHVNKVNACTSSEHKGGCLHELHRLFGHRDPEAIKLMCKNDLVDGIKLIDCGLKIQCETCLKAKSTRIPFPKKSKSKSNAVLDLIHSDVCGPMQTMSMGKKRYILTIIDDYSKYTEVYFISHKSDVGEKIKEYIAMVKNKFNRKPKVLRSDRGGEYMGNELKRFLRDEGIKTQYTAPYSPQQNGTAERKNRSLIEMARCLLTDADLPNYLWAEAVNTANYIQNRTITKGADAIPYQLWNDEKPQLKDFVVFGTKCYVNTPAEKLRKLDDRAKLMYFMGYSEESKAFRCYDPLNRKLVISRDVRFIDNPTHQVISLDLSSKEEKTTESIYDDESSIDSSYSGSTSSESSYKECDTSTDMDVTLTDHGLEYRDPTPYHSDVSSDDTISGETSSTDSGATVINVQPSLDEEYGELSTSLSDFHVSLYAPGDTTYTSPPNSDETDEATREPRVSHRQNKGQPPNRFQANLITEPKSLLDALKSEQKSKWLSAMKEEMKSMHKNETWELCELPSDRKAIGCKWIYKTKTDAEGKVIRFKARLVAQGFTQRFGTDYDQIFAPVARQTTFRILLSVASKAKLLVHHLDVKTAFLNGSLKETIYMKQPPGFESENKGLVCKLKKSIYGLKQAAKSWNDEIHRFLTRHSFERSKNDPCLYTKVQDSELVYLLIYVDDILIVAKSMKCIQGVKSMLAMEFDIQDLGEIKQYLGIDVTRDKDGIFHLNQAKYIKKIVNEFGMSHAKVSNVPMQVNYGKTAANTDDGLLLSNKQYQKLIGCLLYISVNTRPDISASISILAQKMSKPRQDDWNELKRVLKYLKGTANLRLALGRKDYNCDLVYGYSDANWADNKSDRKSNSGHVFMVNGATVCWSSRKQSLVALSTCESEFIALSEACRAAIWIRRILIDLKQKVPTATTIYEDNQSCLDLVKEEERLSDRSKHIDTRFCFVKDYIEKGLISCVYCPTDEMLADILTKPLPSAKFQKFVLQFGLHD